MSLTAYWNAATHGIFLSWQWIIVLCSSKKTICLQVVVKAFREPLIKVIRELWMAAYSREDFHLASSEGLISLRVCRHCLKLCRPRFLYLSKCSAVWKCEMVALKPAFGLRAHAVILQLYLLPSTCTTCCFEAGSCGGNSFPSCAGWTVLVQWFHLGTVASLRLFPPLKNLAN